MDELVFRKVMNNEDESFMFPLLLGGDLHALEMIQGKELRQYRFKSQEEPHSVFLSHEAFSI
jgi:hypothetical protein